MEKELKCPKCGSTEVTLLDTFDLVSAKVQGEDGLLALCIGECDHCHTEFRWDQAYKLVGFQGII